MPRDVNLILEPGQVVTANGNGDYIEVEGGALCWAHFLGAAFTGASTTLDVYVMFSVDVGSNYYSAGKFQQLGPTNDNADKHRHRTRKRNDIRYKRRAQLPHHCCRNIYIEENVREPARLLSK